MAAPIINSVTVLYPQGRSYKLPGEAAEILVDAVDPDAQTYQVVITARDAGGATTDRAVGIVQGDPVDLSATADAGHTVSRDPAQPTRFVTV